MRSRRPQAAAGRGILLLLLLAFPASLRAAVAIAIVPPYIEKVVPAGSRVTDTISFRNQGSDPLLVSVDFADFAVTDEGEVSEQAPGTDRTSLASFIRVSPASVRVAPGQQVFFRYSVEAPQDFRQLRAMIYFSSRPEIIAAANQVVVVPRMGVPLYVENIKAAPASLRIDEIKWARSGEKDELLRLELLVLNEGERNIRPTGFLDVRSTQGKFQKVFEFNEGREPVLPGQQRRWKLSFGPVSGDELSVKLRFARSPRTTFDSEFRLPASAKASDSRP